MERFLDEKAIANRVTVAEAEAIARLLSQREEADRLERERLAAMPTVDDLARMLGTTREDVEALAVEVRSEAGRHRQAAEELLRREPTPVKPERADGFRSPILWAILGPCLTFLPLLGLLSLLRTRYVPDESLRLEQAQRYDSPSFRRIQAARGAIEGRQLRSFDEFGWGARTSPLTPSWVGSSSPAPASQRE